MIIGRENAPRLNELYGQDLQGVGDRLSMRTAEALIPDADDVEISEGGRLAQEARRLAQVQPAGYADRLARVRAELAGGTYQVDLSDVARKLLS